MRGDRHLGGVNSTRRRSQVRCFVHGSASERTRHEAWARMTRVRRLPLLAERVLALLATALLASRRLSGCGGSSAAPDLSEARARTVDGGTARFTLTIGAAIAGRAVESAEAGTVSFAKRRAHLYKLVPGKGVPQELILDRPDVHERERRRRAERLRRQALDEARHAAPSGRRGGQARRPRARPRPRLPRRRAPRTRRVVGRETVDSVDVDALPRQVDPRRLSARVPRSIRGGREERLSGRAVRRRLLARPTGPRASASSGRLPHRGGGSDPRSTAPSRGSASKIDLRLPPADEDPGHHARSVPRPASSRSASCAA